MKTFERLGFVLNPTIKVDDIDRWGGKSEFDTPPFMTMYITLGQTIEREPWTPLTDRVWHFDMEAIEDHGAYVDIMKNLERITRGELKFSNLKDYVDVENKRHGSHFRFEIRHTSGIWRLLMTGPILNFSQRLLNLQRSSRQRGVSPILIPVDKIR
ncbi:MAG: hypothetical protein IPK01_09120 [Acidobacteria bacterium]|nr:hypothetical protein [Acidobacteriota bacterium]